MAGTEKAHHPVINMAESTEEEEELKQRRAALLEQSRQLARNARGDFVAPAKAGRANRARAKLELVDSVPGSNTRMSDADIVKLGDSQKRSGPLTFFPDNPGNKPGAFVGDRGVVKDARGFVDPLATLDTRPTSRTVAGMQLDQTADKLRAERSVRGLSNNPRLMDQASIKAAVDNRRSEQKASAQRASDASFQAPKSAFARISEIAPNLRPGEYIGVKESNNGRDTLTEARPGGEVKSSVSTEPHSRGLVKDDNGKWVPIVAETTRIGKPLAEAIDRRDKAATDTSAYMQKIADNNPAVQTARKIYNDRIAKANASQGRAHIELAAQRVRASQASPLHAPSRIQIEADRKVLASDAAFKTPPKAVAATREESSAYALEGQKARKKALEARQRLVATR